MAQKTKAKTVRKSKVAMAVTVNGKAVNVPITRGEKLEDYVARVASQAGLASLNLLVGGKSVQPGDAELQQSAAEFAGTLEIEQADVVG